MGQKDYVLLGVGIVEKQACATMDIIPEKQIEKIVARIILIQFRSLDFIAKIVVIPVRFCPCA
jgi:hypothetical protein